MNEEEEEEKMKKEEGKRGRRKNMETQPPFTSILDPPLLMRCFAFYLVDD